jgi:hypothetical protein
MTVPARELTRLLRGGGVARGVAALALGAYVASREGTAGADIARASGVFWIVDGFVTASAVRLSGALLPGRVVVLVRGSLAVAAGALMLGLPLGLPFGPWEPGKGLAWMIVAGFTLAVVAFQLVAVAFDILICAAIRRRIPREWTWALGAALSAALAVAVGSTFVVPADGLGHAVAAVAFAAGFALLVGAGKMGEARAVPPVSVSPPKP